MPKAVLLGALLFLLGGGLLRTLGGLGVGRLVVLHKVRLGVEAHVVDLEGAGVAGVFGFLRPSAVAAEGGVDDITSTIIHCRSNKQIILLDMFLLTS